MYWREDPGECIVCGAAHCSCTVDGDGRIVVPQRATPATSVTVRKEAATPPAEEEAEEAVSFTTSTYRRAVHGPGRRARGTVT